MPELPEVETVRRGLADLIVGRVIDNASYSWPKSFPNAPADIANYLIGSQVTDVLRRGKVLLIQLSSGYTLACHLKMTGQLVFVGQPKVGAHKPERFGAGHPNDSLIGHLPDRSTRVILAFTDGSNLFFNDQRKFGWLRLVPTNQLDELDFIKRLGPEPLEAGFTWQVLAKRLARRPRSKVKAVILDQTILVGVGNIYADESLWAAQIHPETRAGNLSTSQIKKLHKEIVAVLKLSIQKGGSTDRNYVDAEGKKGSYLTFARVFRREGQACPRCNELVVKIRSAGRGTHLCLNCQKLQEDRS